MLQRIDWTGGLSNGIHYAAARECVGLQLAYPRRSRVEEGALLHISGAKIEFYEVSAYLCKLMPMISVIKLSFGKAELYGTAFTYALDYLKMWLCIDCFRYTQPLFHIIQVCTQLDYDCFLFPFVCCASD